MQQVKANGYIQEIIKGNNMYPMNMNYNLKDLLNTIQYLQSANEQLKETLKKEKEDAKKIKEEKISFFGNVQQLGLYEELLSKYKLLSNENEQLKYKVKNMNHFYNKPELVKLNEELIEKLLNAKNEKDRYEKEINHIKNQKKADFEQNKKNDYDEEFVGKKLEDYYDVVINIKSILSLEEEGWEIKWNKNTQNLSNKLKDKKLLKVGVLGNGNVGKSFLLSRLLGDKIPSGFSVITEGLSLKYNEKENYAILDSAGLQTPLTRKEEYIEKKKNNNELSPDKTPNDPDQDEEEKLLKKYENLYRDKTQTENFIQNLIINESDVLLVVVGKLTFNEQKLTNKIKKDLEQDSENRKPIFIIHNLMNFHKIEQVEWYIKDTLLKSASFQIIKKPYIDIRGKYKGREYFTEKKEKLDVYHLIMAREKTEAGDYYNDFTYDYIKTSLNKCEDREPLSVIEEVKEKFVKWSKFLLEEPILKENIKIEEKDGVPVKYIFESKVKVDDKTEEKRINPKACISDELGLSLYRSSKYEPAYYYFIENESKLVLVMEIPGTTKFEEIYANTDSYEIIVRGERNNRVKSTETFMPIKNVTKAGKFSLHIPYGDKIKIAQEDPIEEENPKNGIYIYKFLMISKRKKQNNNK